MEKRKISEILDSIRELTVEELIRRSKSSRLFVRLPDWG